VSRVVRCSKPLLATVLILFVFSLMPSIGLAQQNFGVPTNDSALPDAPQPQQNTEGRNTLAADGGSTTGTVFDTNRDVLQGARRDIGEVSRLCHANGGIWE